MFRLGKWVDLNMLGELVILLLAGAGADGFEGSSLPALVSGYNGLL